MNKVLLVLRHELTTTVRRRSFLLVTFGIPLVGVLVLAVIFVMNQSSPGILTGLTGPQGAGEIRVDGFVDRTGLITVVPEDVADRLVRYVDEARALDALETGKISGYYVIPENYIKSGQLVYVDPEASPFSIRRQDWVIRWTLLVNMLGGDVELAGRVQNPMDLQATSLAQEPQDDDDEGRVSYARISWITVFTYAAIVIASSLLFTSARNERKNRVMEIMMLSINPRQMLTGKIIGLGIASILGMVAWGGAIYIALRMGGPATSLMVGLQFPPSLWSWGIAFFLLGYVLYATLMAGVGALVQRPQEDSQARWVVSSPLLISYFISIIVLIDNPNGALATALSLFPLSAPVAIVPRLAIGGVPPWQPPLAAALMLVTIPLIVRAVSKIFRAQTLLSGQRFSVGRFFGVLLGRG